MSCDEQCKNFIHIVSKPASLTGLRIRRYRGKMRRNLEVSLRFDEVRINLKWGLILNWVGHQPWWLNLISDVTHNLIFLRIGINRCVAIATLDLIGFSHPKASFFLLLRQKKETKEKATRMPLGPCAPSFLSGVAKRDSCPFGNARLPPRPFGLFPTKTTVFGAAYGVES